METVTATGLQPVCETPTERIDDVFFDVEKYLPSLAPPEKVKLSWPQSLVQMRGQMTAGGVEDLKASISERGGMINEPIYAVLNEDSMASYIDAVNEAWDSTVSIDNFFALTEGEHAGQYMIVVAGHRRTVALKANADEEEIPYDRYAFDAKIVTDPDPYDILAIQLAENVYEPPPKHRYAAMIEEMYKLGLASERWDTPAGFIRNSPMKEDTVRNALKFMQQPPEIFQMVADGHLNYGIAVELYRLREPRVQRFLLDNHPDYVDLPLEELPAYVRTEVEKDRDETIIFEAVRAARNGLTTSQSKARVGGLLQQWHEPLDGDGLIALFESHLAAGSDEEAAMRQKDVLSWIRTDAFAVQAMLNRMQLVEGIIDEIDPPPEELAQIAGALAAKATVTDSALSYLRARADTSAR